MRKTGGPDARPRLGPFLLLAGAVPFVLLHFVASAFFPERIWGAHHLRYLAPWGLAAWAFALTLPLLPGARRALLRGARRADALLDEGPVLAGALLFLAAAAVFILFRTRNLFLGDGYLITSVVQNPEETGMGAAGFVSLAIHKALLAAMRVPFPDTGGAAPFVLTSALAGASVLFFARFLARELAGEGPGRALLFLSLTLSGGMLLFFGYVEYYPLMQGALLLYFALAVRFLRGRGSLLPPTAALLLAFVLHISSIALAPSWLFLLGRGGFSRRKLFAVLIPLTLVAAAGAWGVLRYTEKFYSGLQAVVPLFDKGIHAYPFFSGHHVAFVLNEVLLLFGGALVFPVLLLVSREGAPDRAGDREVGRFLAGAAALGLLYLLILDPLLGARDWDLMAIPLFPFLLFLGHRVLGRRLVLSENGAVFLAGLLFFHSFPWVAAQLDRDRAVAMTVAMTTRDPHYANPEARAPKSFGVLLARAGYHEQASLFFEKAVDLNEDAQNLFNLGTSKAKQGDYAAAVPLLERAIRAAPGYHAAYSNLAWCWIQLQEPDKAEEVVRALLSMAATDSNAYRFLGIVQVQREQYEEAIRSFETAVRYDPEDEDSWARLGVVLARQGRLEEASDALRRALSVNPNNTQAAHALRTIEENR